MGIRQQEQVQHPAVFDRAGVGDAAVLEGVIRRLRRQISAAENDDCLPGIAGVRVLFPVKSCFFYEKSYNRYIMDFERKDLSV